MAGSKNSMILFLTAAVFLVIQTGVSIAIFDDGIGAMASGVFAFVMLISAWLAMTGNLSAVTQSTTTDGPGYRTTTTWDTGDRIQMTPCCGICGGIMIIVVALIFAGTMSDDEILALAPSFIAAIISILAGIVFAVEYKGPWTRKDF